VGEFWFFTNHDYMKVIPETDFHDASQKSACRIRNEATGQIRAKPDPISAKPVPKLMRTSTIIHCPLTVQ